MEKLNFNHLYYFYIVAKEGSIKVAAEKLFVSQPTISDQIKLLEEYFECALFERKNRSMQLTDEGRLALARSESIFMQANELTSILRNQDGHLKRTLDIGITHFMSHFFLYETFLPLFKDDESAINIREDERHLLLADLEKGRLDMIFTDSKDSLSGIFDAYRVGVNRTFAVAHKKMKKRGGEFPEMLNSMPFFNHTNDSFFKYEIELFFSKHKLSPKIIGEGDDIDLFDVITKNALAFTIVPEVAKNRLILNKDVIVLGELKELQASVWGIIRKDNKGLCYNFLKNR